jgi:ketosteroid isomerase-like protein
MTVSEIATVLAWHDALNANDLDTLAELSSDDIEVGDAHGAIQGHDALRRWATTSGFTAEPGRMYVHDGVVVVEQQVRTASQPGTVSTMASAFRVVHDKVTSVFRHADLTSALSATELTEDDRDEAPRGRPDRRIDSWRPGRRRAGN